MLVVIAKNYIGVPSLSSAVECLFDIAGKPFSPKKYRLIDSRYEQ